MDIGADGSGTARLLQETFDSRDFVGLGIQVSRHPLNEVLTLAERGEIDLAALVIDEDSPIVEAAVRDRGLQIAGFPNVDVVARRYPLLRHGSIGAGQYDAERMLPPVDKRVLRIETLVVGNGCARRSEVLGANAPRPRVPTSPRTRHGGRGRPRRTRATLPLPLARARSWAFDGA